MRFDGTTAIVTGAGRGLGRLYALGLAERGCRVIVNDAGVTTTGEGGSRSPADDVVAEIRASGGVAAPDYSDITATPAEVVTRAMDEFGGIDIVINNAGTTTPTTPFQEISKAAFDRVVSINLDGSIGILRAAWPHLLESGAGRVVNISSAGVWGEPGLSSYAAAKAGIIGLTRVLAQEGRPFNVNVNAVMPHGLTRLLSTLPEDHPIARRMREHFSGEAVAPFVLWLAHADTSVSGEMFAVGGGRATRVFLGVAEGCIPTENTPESWRASAEELLRVDAYRIPASTSEEMTYALEILGIEG